MLPEMRRLLIAATRCRQDQGSNVRHFLPEEDTLLHLLKMDRFRLVYYLRGMHRLGHYLLECQSERLIRSLQEGHLLKNQSECYLPECQPEHLILRSQ